MAAKNGRKICMKTATASSDRRTQLEALAYLVAGVLDSTNTAAAVPSLARVYLEILDRQDALDEKEGIVRETKASEKVTAFEAIAGRRSDRRAAAQA